MKHFCLFSVTDYLRHTGHETILYLSDWTGLPEAADEGCGEKHHGGLRMRMWALMQAAYGRLDSFLKCTFNRHYLAVMYHGSKEKQHGTVSKIKSTLKQMLHTFIHIQYCIDMCRSV